MTDLPLNDRIAIVTGASSGLGRAMAAGLARAGATVVATASSATGALATLAGDIERETGRALIVPMRGDVTSEADCARIVGDTLGRFGRLHVLVNNAGRGMKYVSDTFLTTPTRFWDVEPATWRQIVDTNVNGPFFMTRAAVPHMLAARWGRIVNISMNHDTMRRKGFSPYGPSKAALESETIIWAQDLDGTGITVNALLPGGAADTGMIPESVPQDARRHLLRPAIMIPPLIWLASEVSGGFTGRRIVASEWTGQPGDKPPGGEAGWR